MARDAERRDADDRELAGVAAALLGAGRVTAGLSAALAAAAGVGLLVPLVAPVPAWSAGALAVGAVAASLFAGLGAAYCGVRVAFDAALFRRLADGRGTLASLDGALTTLRLLPPAKVGRPLAERVAGALRLLRRQAALVMLQAAALLAAAGVALAESRAR